MMAYLWAHQMSLSMCCIFIYVNTLIKEASIVDISATSGLSSQIALKNVQSNRVVNHIGRDSAAKIQAVPQHPNKINNDTHGQAQKTRHNAQKRQAERYATKQANDARQGQSDKVRLTKQVRQKQTDQIQNLQDTRRFDVENQARVKQAAAEVSRSNQDRQDAVAQARRSAQKLPRGSIVDVFG